MGWWADAPMAAITPVTEWPQRHHNSTPAAAPTAPQRHLPRHSSTQQRRHHLSYSSPSWVATRKAAVTASAARAPDLLLHITIRASTIVLAGMDYRSYPHPPVTCSRLPRSAHSTRRVPTKLNVCFGAGMASVPAPPHAQALSTRTQLNTAQHTQHKDLLTVSGRPSPTAAPVPIPNPRTRRIAPTPASAPRPHLHPHPHTTRTGMPPALTYQVPVLSTQSVTAPLQSCTCSALVSSLPRLLLHPFFHDACLVHARVVARVCGQWWAPKKGPTETPSFCVVMPLPAYPLSHLEPNLRHS